MNKCGLDKDETFIVRMTGCPNGCARPYTAEMGFVADGANSYQLWLGGSPGQTRLAREFMSFKIQKLEETFEPIFVMFNHQRLGKDESFGDFADRVGFDALKDFMKSYDGDMTKDYAQASTTVVEKKDADSVKKQDAPITKKTDKESVSIVLAASKPVAETPAASKPVAVKPAAITPTKAGILPRVMIQEEAFSVLQLEAEKKGLTLSELASEAILEFLAKKG